MALLVLQPAAILQRFGGGSNAGGVGGVGVGDGGGAQEEAVWRELLQELCGVCVVGAGVLSITGLVSPTK